MKKVILALLLSSVFFVFAQDAKIKKAQEAFEHKEYLSVITYLNKVRFSDLTEHQKLLRAESYKKTNQYRKALHAFENLDYETLNTDWAYLHFAQVLQSNGSYEKAKKYYKLYQNRNPDHSSSIQHITTCNNLKVLNSFGVKATVLPSGFSTKENDLTGFIFNEELVFASGGYSRSLRRNKWDGEHYLNYYHNYEGQTVGFSSILNTKLHEGPGFYDTVRNTLFFTRNSLIHDESSSTLSNLKIYESLYEDNKWSKPKELPFNDEVFSRGHPTSLSGRDFLIYSSNQVGGYGEVDLYISYKENGKWKAPRNLGKDINTEGKEVFPFLANDSTLYFSSNGHGGHGGLDLFVCKINNGIISGVTNLGNSFNTSQDDFGLLFLNKECKSGYYCSDKSGGLGSSDIYKFSIDETNKIIRFVDPWNKAIVNKAVNLSGDGVRTTLKTNSYGEIALNLRKDLYLKCELDTYYPKIEDVRFTRLDTVEIMLYPKDYFTHVSGHLKNEENDSPVDHAQITVDVDNKTYQGETDEAGDFDLLLPRKKEYVFKFIKDGFLSSETIISDDNTEHNSKIQQVEKGTILRLENIYYEFDKDFITEKAEPILKTLVKIMILNPELEIEVSSHSDSRGAVEYNKDLSLRRAKAVVEYLEKKGIDTERLSIKYYGERRLVNDCGDDKNCLENIHSKNRRTEFKVVRF